MGIAGIPTNYEYGHLKEEINKFSSLRSNTILNKADFLKWLEEYSSNTLTTWRILKTFPDSGKINVYKSVWRCHHYVYKQKGAPTSSRASKNTNCPAKIVVVIKRFIEKSRSKDPEYVLNKEWPCKIEINTNHNHPLTPLFTCTVNSKVLLEPANTANNTNELNTASTVSTTAIQDISDDWLQESHDNENGDCHDSNSPTSQIPVENTESDSVQVNKNVKSSLMNDLDKLVSWMKRGISDNPKDFLSALHIMMNNVKRNVKTDDELISAMQNFGKHTKCAKVKPNIGKRKFSRRMQNKKQTPQKNLGSVSISRNIEVLEYDCMNYNELQGTE